MVVREGLPEEVAFKQKSSGVGSEGRELKAEATANRNILGQESLDGLEQP